MAGACVESGAGFPPTSPWCTGCSVAEMEQPEAADLFGVLGLHVGAGFDTDAGQRCYGVGGTTGRMT